VWLHLLEACPDEANKFITGFRPEDDPRMGPRARAQDLARVMSLMGSTIRYFVRR
jgi:hypothetical protein